MVKARTVDEILAHADELAARFESYEPQPLDELRERLRAALIAAGDPERARAQQAYMKSEMPYYGVSSPELKALLRPLLAEFKPASRGVWEETVRTLWDGATHREERYAAIAFAQHRAAKKWQDPDALDLYRTSSSPAPGGTSSTSWRAIWSGPCSSRTRGRPLR